MDADRHTLCEAGYTGHMPYLYVSVQHPTDHWLLPWSLRTDGGDVWRSLHAQVVVSGLPLAAACGRLHIVQRVAMSCSAESGSD